MTADDFEYFEADTHYDGIGRAHNIAANPETNTLYVVGCTDSLGDRNNYTVCEGRVGWFVDWLIGGNSSSLVADFQVYEIKRVYPFRFKYANMYIFLESRGCNIYIVKAL